MSRRVLLLVASLCLTARAFGATQGGTPPVPLPLGPPNNWWNIDVSNAPIDPGSAGYLQYIGLTKGLHPDFGGNAAAAGYIYGLPFIVVEGDQTKKVVSFTYSEESDGVNHQTNQSFAFYPIPDEAITQTAWVENGPPGNVDLRNAADRHILIVDRTNNTLYELWNVWYSGTQWFAGSGAFFDLKTNNRRGEGWTSADAAGLAILPGLVRYDEVYGSAEIRHAFRITVRATNNYYVYPASHVAGSTLAAPPLGTRLRLKASKDISGFSAEMQRAFRAMKKYGLIIADNGSDMYISGTYDTRWNNDVLNPAFGALKTSDFEVVQLGWKPSTIVVGLPPAMGAGDVTSGTVTIYDSNYNLATGYRGTVQFTSTDGAATLPVNYTFTAGDSGTHTFTGGFTLRTFGSQVVTANDVATPSITGSAGITVGPSAPTSFVATAATATSVALSWTAPAGATQYEVVRQSSLAGGYVTLTTTASTTFTDTPVLANTTYLYKVRAIDALSRVSPFSAPDAATTVLFTDDPLTVPVTKIRGVHVTELRQAINVMRSAGGLTAAIFTDAAPAGVRVKAEHQNEMRTALDAARTALGLSAIVYADPTLIVGTTKVNAAHVEQLRAGVR